MSWHEVQLGDGIRIKHGFAFKSRYFADAGRYIVLTPGNFNEEGGGFCLRPGKDRFYSGDIPEVFILSEGDLIVAMTEQAPGLLGSPAFIPESDRYLHNQRLGRIEALNPNLLDKTFLYYLFNTRSVRQQISGSASGTKVRHTSPERIYRIRATVPDITTQKKIGRLLQNYDSLIQNNRRRVQLLEQAARLLYKEWFVHLRFPGHEHVKIKDGVPEGWEKQKLGEIAPLNYGKGLKEEDRIPGAYPVYGSSGIVGTHEKPLVQGPGIIVGRKGNVGSVYWSGEGFHPIDTVYFIGREKSSLYLYYSLLQTSFINTDVAVPGLNRDLAQSRELLIAEAKLKLLFEETVIPIHKQIHGLKKFNEALAKARDFLLPRLMSGEIAV
jgi:type I restriction enzyme S subunit